MKERRANTEPEPSLRLDARRNLEKLKAAALEVFQLHGLGTPLEEIAKHAGVSTGTLYNRFGSRDGLIDAVVPELAAAKLATALERAGEGRDSWARFSGYLLQLCELQATNPVLNDILSGRFPEARQLAAVCEDSLKHARRLIKDAQRDGALRTDFTGDDFFFVLWSNANVIRATASAAPDAWRRGLGLLIDGLRAHGAHKLPVGAASVSHARQALLSAASGARRK
jgi:AcrR family transcriptional regulator